MHHNANQSIVGKNLHLLSSPMIQSLFASPRAFSLFSRLAYLLAISVVCDARTAQSTTSIDIESLEYRVYPRRTHEEAAVIEWGHSAIISALDVSVAHFGPQTSQAALFEVETMPVLASPINGVKFAEDSEGPVIRPLDNAEDVEGNVVVMTNAGGLLSGVQMALIAQKSGAAALLVVNMNEKHPDDIYRLPGDDTTIDIPVVMMSYNSATILTSATVTPETKPEDIVNHGMPERIRLYAGGDRPFFEDVVSSEPPVYLIHNLLTAEECETLVSKAAPLVRPVDGEDDPLQLLQSPADYVNSHRVLLWQGLWQTAGAKAIEERIEQATGFPPGHLTDFVVDRVDSATYWKPHYDKMDAVSGGLPMATITIFLTETKSAGASIVYPTAKGGPVQIQPQQGLAVIHHNVNERHEFERNAISALMKSSETVYVARKYVLFEPISNGRRIALPLFAILAGGRLPGFVVSLYKLFADQFGHETGGMYFDKLCVFVPLLIIFGVIQLIAGKVLENFRKDSSSSEKGAPASEDKTSSMRRRKTEKNE